MVTGYTKISNLLKRQSKQLIILHNVAEKMHKVIRKLTISYLNDKLWKEELNQMANKQVFF